jgi:hypothetical protein
MTTVLAIDPGYELTAWVVYDATTHRIIDFGREPNGEFLARLRSGWWRTARPAIEMIASYGMPVGREVFETCVWIGRFAEALDISPADLAAHLVYRQAVKLHLCKSAKANDATIRAALIDRFGPTKERAIGTKKAPGPLYGIKADVWAALAVAVTSAEAPRAEAA